MEIKTKDVAELRKRTGAGMLDCRDALVEAEGDIDKAVDLLREQGIAGADKKADRIASEGLVESYIHGGRIGVLVEVNTETDFVAKNEEFQTFVRDIAMQVAASKPEYVSREEIPEEQLERERSVQIQLAKNENEEQNIPADRSEMIAQKKVEGRMERYFEKICLLDQPFIKDPSTKVGELLTDLISKIGENIRIRRFVRFEVGEGLEKREEDFAAEVAKQMK